MRSFAAVLAFAASALAIQVTAPTNATGWATSGQNTVKWNAVSTDPKNFTIVLVNQAQFPPYEQQLAALVDSSAGSFACNPPSTGWPSGSGFQVNLVSDAQHLNTILAQSDQFSFHASSASGSSTAVSVTSNPTGTLTVSNTAGAASPSNSGAAGSGSGSGDLNPSTSDTATSPSGTNNGASATGAGATFFGLVALVGAFLA